MNLVIFDIDGTLTNTSSIDASCFVRAFAISFGVSGIDTDWQKYPHPTDSGIALQVFHDKLGRTPSPDDLLKLQQCFVRLLTKHCMEDSARFDAIRGAADSLRRLRKEANWRVAIASGCWRESAKLKLRAAGIETPDIPAAFSDDGVAREDILRLTIARALAHYRQARFVRIVSVGDGLWDVCAARNLGLAFVGIGSDQHALQLREAGANHVLEDLRNYEYFLQALIDATIPCKNGSS